MPGDDELALAIYQALRAHGGFASEAELGRAAGVDGEQVRRGRRRLEELGLLQHGDGLLEPVEPETALLRTMTAYQASAAQQASAAASLQQLTDALMSVYRPAVAGDTSQVEVEFITGSRRKGRTLSELDATCRHGVDSMHPGPMPHASVLEASLERDEVTKARGIRLRSIYPLALLQNPRYVRYLQRLSDVGAEVRLLDHAPCDILIHDQSTACLPAAPGTLGGPMLLVRGTALVRVMSGFYEDFWLRATSLEQARAAADGGDSVAELTPQERTVIRLMAGGLSDDQIARKTGVHRRTVQRTVAKLMERLHASSRFEAGLKLAQSPEFARTLRVGSAAPGPAAGPTPAGQHPDDQHPADRHPAEQPSPDRPSAGSDAEAHAAGRSG
ncbi:helix-turn-helix transcriptional regulator [Streptomyces sp. V4-01]|uniref:Helix-turn-helix transcriptional regulator n=1 Tax=Actinacidiphila polyblastidii TaxID=3110430 RepID=A0ABU7PJ00_9ACTN|nr:helix-turn-helix transcriptional regulator [Streptomyces sp. V4-01]